MNITKEQLRTLAKLDALERGGVDNWEFYDEALTDIWKNLRDEDVDGEFKKQVNNRLLNLLLKTLKNQINPHSRTGN